MDDSQGDIGPASRRRRFTGISSGGFIRAEVTRYEDLIALGDEQKVKAAGKLMVKGKDAEVLDGDVIHFLFKV